MPDREKTGIKFCKVIEIRNKQTKIYNTKWKPNTQRFPLSVRESFCFPFQNLKLR